MTTSITIFDLVLVPFPFTDLSKSKKRPCLVLNVFQPKNLSTHFIAAMVTSHLEGHPFPQDTSIEEFEKAGLPKPSLIRLSKLVTLDVSLIDKKLGKLSSKDQKAVEANFKKFFSQIL